MTNQVSLNALNVLRFQILVPSHLPSIQRFLLLELRLDVIKYWSDKPFYQKYLPIFENTKLLNFRYLPAGQFYYFGEILLGKSFHRCINWDISFLEGKMTGREFGDFSQVFWGGRENGSIITSGHFFLVLNISCFCCENKFQLRHPSMITCCCMNIILSITRNLIQKVPPISPWMPKVDNGGILNICWLKSLVSFSLFLLLNKFCLHFDHISSLEYFKNCLDSGFF